MIIGQNLLSIDRYNEIINESKNISDTNIQKLTFELINLKKSFDLIINNAVDGYWEWDLISNKTYISESLKLILGAEISEYEGNFIETESLVHPFDRDLRNQVINNSLLDYTDYSFEYRLKCKDQKYYYFLAKGTYLKDEHGKAIKLIGTLININNQKLNQQELKLKEYVIENTLSPVTWLNKSGMFVNANKAYLELVGYSFDELIKLHVKEIDSNFNEDIWDEHWLDLKANKTLYLFAKSKNKNGEYQDIQITANYVKIDDIELNCAFVIDITEKLKLEKEIIDIHNRYKSVIEHSNENIFAINLNCEYLIYNQTHALTFENIFGKKPNIGDNLLDLIKGSQQYNEYKDLIQIGFDNDKYSFIKSYELFLDNNKENKDVITIETRINQIKDENSNMIGLAFFSRDITKEYKIQKQISESEQRFQKLLNVVPNIAIQGFNKEGNIVYWNKASEELYNYKSEEVINQNIYDLIVQDEEKQELIDENNYIFDKKMTSPSKELIVKNKEGKNINVLSTISYLELNENTQHLYCFDVDMTDINIARQKINDLLDELTEKNSELETIISDKDKIFSIIAHDLRSPLSGFMALTKELLDNLVNLEESEILEFASVLKSSSENVYNLLENLLSWSQFQRGVIDCHPEEIYFNYIISNNIELLTPKANDKHISFINLSNGPFIFSADLQMINTIIRNLLSNAIKYSYPNNVIEIGIIDGSNKKRFGKTKKDNSSETIAEILNEKEMYLIKKYYKKDFFTFYVRDFGIGMSKEIANNLGVFSNQTKRIGTHNESSSGLGLVITYDFVKAHNGNVYIESEEDKGSTFIVQLPNKK